MCRPLDPLPDMLRAGKTTAHAFAVLGCCGWTMWHAPAARVQLRVGQYTTHACAVLGCCGWTMWRALGLRQARTSAARAARSRLSASICMLRANLQWQRLLMTQQLVILPASFLRDGGLMLQAWLAKIAWHSTSTCGNARCADAWPDHVQLHTYSVQAMTAMTLLRAPYRQLLCSSTEAWGHSLASDMVMQIDKTSCTIIRGREPAPVHGPVPRRCWRRCAALLSWHAPRPAGACAGAPPRRPPCAPAVTACADVKIRRATQPQSEMHASLGMGSKGDPEVLCS